MMGLPLMDARDVSDANGPDVFNTESDEDNEAPVQVTEHPIPIRHGLPVCKDDSDVELVTRAIEALLTAEDHLVSYLELREWMIENGLTKVVWRISPVIDRMRQSGRVELKPGGVRLIARHAR
jgi:hypothetical protein